MLMFIIIIIIIIIIDAVWHLLTMQWPFSCHATGLFLYPLKISKQKARSFWRFQRL